MSARAVDIERLDAWLSAERSADDILAQMRDHLCNVIWVGDDLYRETDALAKHAPRGFVLDLPQYREAWQIVGGQAAVDAFDALVTQLREVIR